MQVYSCISVLSYTVMDALRQQLQCSVCGDIYSKPKQLRCHHAFCEECLLNIVRYNRPSKKLTCPACRKHTKLPDNGVKALPAAFHINNFLEIVKASKIPPALQPREDLALEIPPPSSATTFQQREAEALAIAKLRWQRTTPRKKKHRVAPYNPAHGSSPLQLQHCQSQQQQSRVSAGFSTTLRIYSSFLLHVQECCTTTDASFTPPLFPSPPTSPKDT